MLLRKLRTAPLWSRHPIHDTPSKTPSPAILQVRASTPQQKAGGNYLVVSYT